MRTNHFSETVWAVGRAKKALAFGLAMISALLLLFGLQAATTKLAHAATTFTVTSTADTGGSTCGATCTLRQAINAANATSGADTINFNISGSGPHTITPATELPNITEQVTIDGYSQPGASENTLPLAKDGTNAVIKIVLDGTAASAAVNFADGLFIGGTPSNVVVRGLAIHSFENEAIRFASNNGTGHRVEGNFIGTDASGTSTGLGNSRGVAASSGDDSTIGGDEAGDRNLISGNTGNGIALGTSGNTIQGNIIGTKADGTTPLGNGQNGINIGSIADTGNRFLDNAISSNGGLGIDVGADGVTPNDAKDTDFGQQNFPVLSSATLSSSDGATTITGSLSSTPRKVFTIQFFSSPQADPSGFGEGEKFLGELNVRTSKRGKASFKFITIEEVTAGEVVTATATAFGTNDTSEFSAAKDVVQGA